MPWPKLYAFDSLKANTFERTTSVGKKQCIIRHATMGSASRGRIFVRKMLCCVFIVLAFERNTGVEPAFQAWEARALPMC